MMQCLAIKNVALKPGHPYAPICGHLQNCSNIIQTSPFYPYEFQLRQRPLNQEFPVKIPSSAKNIFSSPSYMPPLISHTVQLSQPRFPFLLNIFKHNSNPLQLHAHPHSTTTTYPHQNLSQRATSSARCLFPKS